MKHLIVWALLFVPVSYAADYRQEIMDNMITPCFQEAMKREGLSPSDPRLLAEYKRLFGDQIEQQVQLLQSTLKANPVSYEERKELYQLGLDSCLNG